MPNYSKTIIYKLINYDHPDLVYVGSTTDFTKRKAQHKRFTNSDNQRKVYQNIRENGGWQCWHMIKICDFPCSTAIDARQEEDRQMMELKANLNTIRAYVSSDEKKELKKEYDIEYNKINKEKKNEQCRKYRELHKDHLSIKSKEYYDVNKEKIKEYKQQYQITNKERLNDISKQYYESNKEQLNIKRSEKIKCECGCFVSRRNMSEHKKSLKHQNLSVQSTTIESVSPLD